MTTETAKRRNESTMPLYAYKCPSCGAESDDFNRIDERHTNAPNCDACAVQMAMVIPPVRGSVQETCHYLCPQTGQGVTSWAQRRNIFAEHRLVDARDLNNSEARRKRKERKAAELEAARKADVHSGIPA